MAEIKTTKELKRVIFDYCVKNHIPPSRIMHYLNSFEAGVREECKKCPIFRHHKSHSVIKGYDAFSGMLQKCKECKIYQIFGITKKQLRLLLEGEGGEKKG